MKKDNGLHSVSKTIQILQNGHVEYIVGCSGTVAAKKWVQRRCSGVKDSLQAGSAPFMCKKCQGETPPSMMAE